MVVNFLTQTGFKQDEVTTKHTKDAKRIPSEGGAPPSANLTATFKDNVTLDYAGVRAADLPVHLRVMVRTSNGNDDGQDLLRQHLLPEPH